MKPLRQWLLAFMLLLLSGAALAQIGPPHVWDIDNSGRITVHNDAGIATGQLSACCASDAYPIITITLDTMFFNDGRVLDLNITWSGQRNPDNSVTYFLTDGSSSSSWRMLPNGQVVDDYDWGPGDSDWSDTDGWEDFSEEAFEDIENFWSESDDW